MYQPKIGIALIAFVSMAVSQQAILAQSGSRSVPAASQVFSPAPAVAGSGTRFAAPATTFTTPAPVQSFGSVQSFTPTQSFSTVPYSSVPFDNFGGVGPVQSFGAPPVQGLLFEAREPSRGFVHPPLPIRAPAIGVPVFQRRGRFFRGTPAYSGSYYPGSSCGCY